MSSVALSYTITLWGSGVKIPVAASMKPPWVSLPMSLQSMAGSRHCGPCQDGLDWGDGEGDADGEVWVVAVAPAGDGEVVTAALGAAQDAITRTAAAASNRPMQVTTVTRRWGYVERYGTGRREWGRGLGGLRWMCCGRCWCKLGLDIRTFVC